jgi:hypothetical protein
MHNLPDTVLRSKDYRSPQSDGGHIFPSTNLGLGSLYQHNVDKLRSCVLRYNLKGNHLAIRELRCGTLGRGSNLLLSTSGRAKGIKESYVFSVGEHHLGGFRVPFYQFTLCELKLLNCLVEIIYRSHLDITSLYRISQGVYYLALSASSWETTQFR